MLLRTFRAKSMPQALDLIRQDLGPEATVLHARRVGGSLTRWVFGPRYEVVATGEPLIPGTRAGEQSAPAEIDGPTNAGDFVPAAAHVASQYAKDRPRDPADRRESDLPAAELATLLAEAEFDDESIARLLEKLTHDGAVADRAGLTRLLAAELPIAGPLRVAAGARRVVALVGPTGVGKTTTIAKLAAAFSLREQRRVGLITVDTFRVAAAEQLRTYAEIMDLPLEIVATLRDVRDAVERLQECELILLDTVGCSPQDAVRLRELKALLAEARVDEVHLVLSAVASQRSLRAAADQFAAVGTTALLFTKLDEALGLGPLYGVARRAGLPLSYLAIGQQVPDDLSLAEGTTLAELMLDAVEPVAA